MFGIAAGPRRRVGNRLVAGPTLGGEGVLVLSAVATAFVVTAAAWLLTVVVVRSADRGRPETWPQRRPFLGGGEPATHAWSRHHARYYPMALVFIAFEMEMMFMYPWAVVFVREGGKALAEMGMFLGLLSLGIFYAWREGAFRWQ